MKSRSMMSVCAWPTCFSPEESKLSSAHSFLPTLLYSLASSAYAEKAFLPPPCFCLRSTVVERPHNEEDASESVRESKANKEVAGLPPSLDERF